MRARALRDISLRGWLSLARWTVFGTLGCMTVSVTFNWIAFRDMDPEVFHQSIVSALVISAMLAGPLFFYLTLKLRELAVANHTLNRLACTDDLTGCLNRAAFMRAAESYLSDRRMSGTGGAGALLVVDADNFKNINDRFGHQQGDIALQQMASAVCSAVRNGDVVGRLGGEEFGAFLPDAGADTARTVAERIRAAIAAAHFMPDGASYRLSASIGCAVFQDAPEYRELFRHADETLYEAKHTGRDRVVMTEVPPLQSEADLAAAS